MSSSSHPSNASRRAESFSKHLQDPNAAKMKTDYKFEGWMALDKDSANGKMVWQEFEPKTWTEDDVDIKVSHCGVCGSDVHTLRSGWVHSSPWLNF